MKPQKYEDSKFLWGSILFAAAGLIYLFSPIDIVPDFFFGFGQIDDVVVLGLTLREAWKSWTYYKLHRTPKSTDSPQDATEIHAEGRVVDDMQDDSDDSSVS
ncbi:MAG: YkvA family protein [Ruthenibacterium sp.]